MWQRVLNFGNIKKYFISFVTFFARGKNKGRSIQEIKGNWSWTWGQEAVKTKRLSRKKHVIEIRGKEEEENKV